MTLNILWWWVAFFVLGLALQQALPVRMSWLPVCFWILQERFALSACRGRQLLALILVQGRRGHADFGTSVLWYLLIIIAFFIGALDVRDGKLLFRTAPQRLYLGLVRWRHLADDRVSVYSSGHDAAAGRKHSPRR